ncbi:unnamed protein product [Effrenium voratum]|uniref:Uncharacterized protein n=1 Tax=Effrenium voratum TaxID=2562239 RepID=A0AA36JIH2_9DINO|nr:unnamed protein product [Effrenium voratum]CAJ1457480.1 unnamed protein product [Effrenium voratum]
MWPLGFVAGERYGFRVPVRVPQWPSTGFDLFLELGYWNQSVGSGLRPFAVVLPGPTPSMIRTPLVDYLTGRVSEEQAVRVRLTTTSPIFSGGGFVFQGGVATRRLQCTCQSVQVGWSCAVGQRPTGELLVTVVVDRALPGTHSVLLACSNPPNAYAAGSWTIGSYQDPLNYPDATQVDAPATAAGFPMQASLEYFERLPRNDTYGFDPRPLRNSSTLLAFRLPQPASLVRLRAPEGSRFQIRCLDQIFTDLSQVFPEAVPQAWGGVSG